MIRELMLFSCLLADKESVGYATRRDCNMEVIRRSRCEPVIYISLHSNTEIGECVILLLYFICRQSYRVGLTTRRVISAKARQKYVREILREEYLPHFFYSQLSLNNFQELSPIRDFARCMLSFYRDYGRTRWRAFCAARELSTLSGRA